MIKGLKIENNNVFVKNEELEAWEKAPCDIIPQLEDLLKKFDGIVYSKEDKKENFIFENEISIGEGSIKEKKDKDGDITYTVTQKNIKVDNCVVNEDYDFGFQDSQPSVNEEKKLVNFWDVKNNSNDSANTVIYTDVNSKQQKNEISTSVVKSSGQEPFLPDAKSRTTKKRTENRELRTTKANADVKNTQCNVEEDYTTPSVSHLHNSESNIYNIIDSQISNDMQSLSLEEVKKCMKIIGKVDITELKGQRLEIPTLYHQTIFPKVLPCKIEPVTYLLKKRLLRTTSGDKLKFHKNFLEDLKEIASHTKDISREEQQIYNRNENISFVKAMTWDNKKRKHGDILRSINYYKKSANEYKEKNDAVFLLESEVIKKYNDDEFDDLLNETLISKND